MWIKNTRTKKEISHHMTAFDRMVENNLKGMELEKANNINAAIRLYEENVSSCFEGNHPYDRLAIIYRKRKDYDNEIRVLEAAISVFSEIKSPRQDVKPKLAKFKVRLSKAKELKNK
ncbi:hypothetical protein [Enterococcus avium]|uniref:hypothetical protein n=1 Tax=Enterococcus avium TaxID=33945 RepID=UPI001C84D8DA|nr:hypothetical protein [Enterococcus avium]